MYSGACQKFQPSSVASMRRPARAYASIEISCNLEFLITFLCSMTEQKRFRVLATSRIGDSAENLLRARGYDLEVFRGPEPPPKKLIIEKVKSGIDGLITTLRDPIDAEVFEAGKGTVKVVAKIAVGFDNINRADANKYKVPFTNTADVLTEATAEFAFF